MPQTLTRPTPRIAACRGLVTYSDNTLKVDKAAGVLHNAALLTVGPAQGHGFDIDDTTLDQFVALANAQPDGVRCRFKHPDIKTEMDPTSGELKQSLGDDTGTMVGRIRNVKRIGSQARGDIVLANYASNLPGLGDVRGYLLSHADEDPSGIGMSPMFTYSVEPEFDDTGNIVGNPARLDELKSVDFVASPAANPTGLLSSRQTIPNPPARSARFTTTPGVVSMKKIADLRRMDDFALGCLSRTNTSIGAFARKEIAARSYDRGLSADGGESIDTSAIDGLLSGLSDDQLKCVLAVIEAASLPADKRATAQIRPELQDKLEAAADSMTDDQAALLGMANRNHPYLSMAAKAAAYTRGIPGAAPDDPDDDADTSAADDASAIAAGTDDDEDDAALSEFDDDQLGAALSVADVAGRPDGDSVQLDPDAQAMLDRIISTMNDKQRGCLSRISGGDESLASKLRKLATTRGIKPSFALLDDDGDDTNED